MSRLWILPVVLCWLCAAVLGQQGDPEAVRKFQRFFKQFKEEHEQVEAVLTLKGNESAAAADELLKLLKHPSGAVQQAALGVLSTFAEAATFQPWIDALPASKDDGQRAAMIKVLGHARMKAALPALQVVAADARASATVRFEVARALLQMGDPSVAATVAPLLGDADPLVRMAAADCVGGLKLRDLGPKLVQLLDDAEWQVQTAAVAALGVVRPQEGVQPLIDLMRKGGRVRVECAEALFKITGYDFGMDAEEWQTQWKRMQEIGWRIPTDAEMVKKAESRKKYDATYGKTGEHNTFAGINTTSTRVLFIIDQSGSMDDLVVEREKFQGYSDFKKFTIVRTELLRTIETLTGDTLFDIVAFATDLSVWSKRLVPANIVNRAAAKAWVERLKPIGGTEDQDAAAAGLTGLSNITAGKTNTLKGILYAFGIDPESPAKAVFTGGDKQVIKNKLDTVYFLSDGRPSVGKLVDTGEILKEVRHYNEMFRIVIHCVAIGEFQKEFLRELATQNNGVFVDLGR